jgi:hypothetical protein
MSTLNLQTLLSPNRLELILSGYTGWNAILSSNMQTLNTILPLLRHVVASATTAIPSEPEPGTAPVYYLPSNAGGIFVDHPYELAIYNPTTEDFTFVTPYDGMGFFCLDTNEYIILRAVTLTDGTVVYKPTYKVPVTLLE